MLEVDPAARVADKAGYRRLHRPRRLSVGLLPIEALRGQQPTLRERQRPAAGAPA